MQWVQDNGKREIEANLTNEWRRGWYNLYVFNKTRGMFDTDESVFDRAHKNMMMLLDVNFGYNCEELGPKLDKLIASGGMHIVGRCS